jgi:hypothetical protein
MAAALGVFGCTGQQTPETRMSNQWYGWAGPATVDPGGDVAKLQGRWQLMPVEENRKNRSEVHLVIDGDTAAFTLLSAPPTRTEDEATAYRFVLNSSVDPKVIRFTHRLGDGEPLPLSPTHGEHNQWYLLDGDTLTLWTVWFERGERAKARYQRVRRGET